MRSPFPGMDPYLEASWSDVHSKLVAYIAEPLSEQLPPGLRVVSEEDLSIASTDPDDPRSLRPDVVIVRGAAAPRPQVATAISSPPARSPLRVHLVREPRVERRVLIIDSQAAGRIVTAIEVLSPVNKSAGEGNRKYLRKLQTYRAGGVNIVEIDLLRHPSRDQLEVNQSHLLPEYQSLYLAGVCRASDSDGWDITPMPLRERLPSIPIPLRPSDSDITLDLQPLLDRIYRVGNYASAIDYTKPPIPPLPPEDAAWAAELLKSQHPAA